MRPLEIAFCTAICPALFWCLAHRGLPGWTRLIPTAALLFLLAHLKIEGARWHMAPAYLAVIAVFLAGVVLPFPRLAPGAVAAACCLLLVASSVALGSAYPVVRLPRPTGPYPVGTVTLHLVDRDRTDPLTGRPDHCRELMLQIWYPAARSGPPEPYRQIAETTFLTRHLSLIPTNAAARVPAASGRFPVILYLPSWGGGRAFGTMEVEELASQGFVVAGIDHPFGSETVVFPDGRIVRTRLFEFLDYRSEETLAATIRVAEEQLRIRTQDSLFVLHTLEELDRSDPSGLLNGRLDVARTGAFGHSFGGAVAANLCLKDERVRCGVNFDGAIFGDPYRQGFGKPFVVFAAQPSQPSAKAIARAKPEVRRRWNYGAEDDRAIRRGLAQGRGYYFELRGAKHIDFADDPYHSPLTHVLPLRYPEAGSIDPRRAMTIIDAYLLSFFRAHLKGEDDGLLDRPAPAYPEIKPQPLNVP